MSSFGIILLSIAAFITVGGIISYIAESINDNEELSLTKIFGEDQ